MAESNPESNVLEYSETVEQITLTGPESIIGRSLVASNQARAASLRTLAKTSEG